MVLRAWWTSLFDSHVELAAGERELVLLRATQTLELERLSWRSRRRREELRRGLRSYRPADWGVWWLLIATLLCLILMAGLMQGGLVGALKAVGLVMLALTIFGGSGILLAGVFYFFLWWVLRPWMVADVRRAICDLGYDEICYRCGYRLKDTPWEILQCSECGAVRERPREISAKDRVMLEPGPELEAPDLVTDSAL